MEREVRGIAGDDHAGRGGAGLPGELGKGTQQRPDIVWVGVVVYQHFQQPFLGVVGRYLDAVDDGFLLQSQHRPRAGLGQGYVPREAGMVFLRLLNLRPQRGSSKST